MFAPVVAFWFTTMMQYCDVSVIWVALMLQLSRTGVEFEATKAPRVNENRSYAKKTSRSQRPDDFRMDRRIFAGTMLTLVT
jgi:hypothetical protein